MKRWIAVAACLLINGLVVRHLWAQQHAAHGYLGVGVAEITEERVKTLKLKSDHGVVVMNVGEETPAARAGLKELDVIVAFNGQPVDGVEQFTRVVRETPPNRKVAIQIVRGGAPQTITATTATRSPANVLGGSLPPMPPMPEMPVIPRTPWDEESPLTNLNRATIFRGFPFAQSFAGMDAEPVGGQLAEYFGVKEGVLVRSVEPESPAQKAGLKAGDVIVRSANKPIRTPSELSRQVHALVARKAPVVLTAVRNHKEMPFTLKIEEESEN